MNEQSGQVVGLDLTHAQCVAWLEGSSQAEIRPYLLGLY